MKILPMLHPVPIVLVGVRSPLDSDKANFTNIGDVAIAGLNPPLVMISLHERHLGREAIDTYGTFSIIVPEAGNVAEVDLCGMVSGRNHDKSKLFKWYFSKEGVPVIETMPVNLICEVREKVCVDKRVIYIAGVTDLILRKDVEENGPTGLDTLMYGLDNNYYIPGKIIGSGYNEGKKVPTGS